MLKSSNIKHHKNICSAQIQSENINLNSNLNIPFTFHHKNSHNHRNISSDKISSLKHNINNDIYSNKKKPTFKLKFHKAISTIDILPRSKTNSLKISEKTKNLEKNKNPISNKPDTKNILSQIDSSMKILHEEVEVMNLEINRKKEIGALLKTNIWEKENILKNKSLHSKKTIDIDNGEFNLNFKTQIDSINAIAMMKEKMILKEKAKEYPRILKDLLSRETENEQKTIIKHIFQNKKIFNFNIFKGKNLNHNSNENKILELNSNLENLNENNDRHPDKKNKENNFDFLTKFAENEMINENKIYDMEQYKQLIREKNKVEMIYRKQLMNIAQEIFELKIQKKKLEDMNCDLRNDLKIAKDEFQVKFYN